MGQKEIHIAQLVVRFLNNELNEAEKKELYKWLEDPDHQKLFDRITNKQNLLNKSFEYDEFDPKPVWSKIDKRIHKRVLLRSWIRYAAAIFIPLTIGIFIFQQVNRINNNLIVKESNIVPGETNATIYFANGEIVDLKKDTSKLIQSEENLIVKRDSNQLRLDSRNVVAEHFVKMNKIVTPRGGEYQLILADGTKVWLNADSYLEFPSKFTGEVRKVKAGGELYFDVAPDKNFPFIVESGDVLLKVLGTEFNIEAYPENESVITTLVEGSVKLKKADEQVIIEPNQQAISNFGDKIFSIQEVNAKDYSLWKEGIFYCENEYLSTIMDKLSRWYNVNIFYMNPSLKDKRFSIEVKRYENIDNVLDILSTTNKVRFKINSNNIIVME